ncbi:hypothetical protein BP6252_00356 [Coleophoma cylindrospora]|uniref:Zn(2)-C6 fungal-type domain-containing protein n=1 Tax=Coleophoma cylindrospora TaxID=1849047 RepID=A0A3D8SQ54_9HELO|nr:hypothetical protein BP6252_00356 [Coleophoma cylindrospora]
MTSPPSTSSSSLDVFVFPIASGAYNDTSVDKHGNPIRKRRQHAKSRSGCGTCKARKVKCDEQRPRCRSCVSRAETCLYQDQRPEKKKKKSGYVPLRASIPMSENVPLRTVVPKSASVQRSQASRSQRVIASRREKLQIPPTPLIPRGELSNLELMHHFTTHTAQTLLFGFEVWQDEVLNLVLENKYLHHAVLLLSAAHLNFLHANASPLSARQTELQHHCLTMAGFRRALSRPTEKRNHDALIACSLIVLQHSWADTSPTASEEQDASKTCTVNSLFPLAAGLRCLVLSTYDIKPSSALADRVCFKQAKPFPWQFCNAAFAVRLELFFGLVFEVGHGDYASGEDTFSAQIHHMQAAERLSTVLSITYDQTDPESADLGLDVARYLFLWPAMCSDGFRRLAEEEDPASLIILLAYAHGIERILPASFWWMHGKASLMTRELVLAIGWKSLESVRVAAAEHDLDHVFDVLFGGIMRRQSSC